MKPQSISSSESTSEGDHVLLWESLMTNIVWSSCVVIKTTVALKCLSVFAVVFTPSVVTANETTTLNISLLCVTYFFHSYLFFVSFSILKSQFFHLLWILFCLYTAACSGLPFALFSAPSSFSKIRSLCQSHFKSVSCFNLLNLFFPQLISFPVPSNTLLIFRCHFHGSCFHPTMSSYIFSCLSSHFCFLSTPFFWCVPPSLSPAVSSLTAVFQLQKEKKDYFSSLIFGKASKRHRQEG